MNGILEPAHGGQNRNRKMCSCRITHIPTGIVKTSQTRSRENSYDEALKDLTKTLMENEYYQSKNKLNILRKKQVSNGERSNYVRTYKFQHNMVVSKNGNKISINDFMCGDLEGLW